MTKELRAINVGVRVNVGGMGKEGFMQKYVNGKGLGDRFVKMTDLLIL